jgi:hypothetical protein
MIIRFPFRRLDVVGKKTKKIANPEESPDCEAHPALVGAARLRR